MPKPKARWRPMPRRSKPAKPAPSLTRSRPRMTTSGPSLSTRPRACSRRVARRNTLVRRNMTSRATSSSAEFPWLTPERAISRRRARASATLGAEGHLSGEARNHQALRERRRARAYDRSVPGGAFGSRVEFASRSRACDRPSNHQVTHGLRPRQGTVAPPDPRDRPVEGERDHEIRRGRR